MEFTASWFIIYLAIMLLAPTLLQSAGISVAMPLLRNLLAYYYSSDRPSAQILAGKSNKKVQRATAELQQSADHRVFQLPLSYEFIVIAPHYERLESCVLAFITFLMAGALHFALAPYGMGLGSVLTFAGALLGGLTLYSLIKVDVLAEDVAKADTKMYLGLGAATAVLCWLVLTLVPAHILDLNLEAVAKDLSDMINPLLEKNFKLAGPEHAEWQRLEVRPLLLTVVLSVLAGVEFTAILTPGLNFGYALHTMMAPAVWARTLIKFNGLQVAAAKLGFVVPLLALLVWIQPMAEVLLLKPATLQWLQPLMLFWVGLHPLLIARPLIQAFLYKGFSEWYVLTHDGRKSPYKHQAVTSRVDVVWRYRAKIVLELLAPTLLIMPVATCLLTSSPLLGPLGLRTEHRVATLFFCKFFGVWTCITWWLVSSCQLTLHRLGLTSGS